jgi:hypothetical protein
MLLISFASSCNTYEASCSDQIDRTLVAGVNYETAFSYFPMELRDLVRNDVAAVAEQVLWGSVLFSKTH